MYFMVEPQCSQRPYNSAATAVLTPENPGKSDVCKPDALATT